MDSENEFQHLRRLPTLVQLCQRAAIANSDAIDSLGDLSYSLVKPILDRSTTDQLLRFEQLSPHLEKDTSEIWRDLCFRIYHLTALDRFSLADVPQHPDSWRSRYFTLQELEAKRIEEIGSKIRTQRLEFDERKKEKEIKYVPDRIPPTKRPRTGGGGWNAVSQPKTLFQKTRSEASKIQRVLNARILPPMPRTKNYRVSPLRSGSTLPSAVSSTNQLIVNNVSTAHHHKASSSSPPSKDPSSISATIPRPTPPPTESSSTTSSSSEMPRSLPKVRSPVKRDPMASLFVPKRKPPLKRPV